MSHATASSDARIDFDTLSDSFVRMKTFFSPAELHGFITGLMSAGQALSEDQWLEECAELLEPESGFDEEQAATLLHLCHQTDETLRDSELTFEPILPDDDDELGTRIDSLGAWCTGFLAGFGVGKGINLQTSEDSDFDFPEDIKETLQDFVGLSQIGAQGDEDDEADYQEVREYIRMAAIMIFIEYNKPQEQAAQDEKPAPTIH